MRAILVKDVSFMFSNEMLLFKAGTEITVDVNESIALADQLHFDIKRDEYAILQ